jgi:hypothetical protein
MTSPIDTAIDQPAAENDASLVERVPVPAQPLPAENPQFPAPSATRSLSENRLADFIHET